jgi:hypothetical protein
MSYNYYSGYAPTIDGIASVQIMASDIAVGLYEDSVDAPNDDVIFVPLERLAYESDTDSTGSLVFSNDGWITALNGAMLQNNGSSYPIEDGAAPVVLLVQVSMDSTPDNNTIVVVYSEALEVPEGYDTAAEAVFDTLRMKADSEQTVLDYATAAPIDVTGSTFIDSANAAVLHGLSKSLTSTLMDLSYFEGYFPSESILNDAAGIPLNAIEPYYFYEMAIQQTPTYAYDAQIVAMTTGSSYKITIPLDNYLSDESETYVSELTNSDFISGSNFYDEMLKAMTTVTLDNETADQIAINIELTLTGGTLAENDYIIIPISSFTGIFGQAVMYLEDSATYPVMGFAYIGGEWVLILPV